MNHISPLGWFLIVCLAGTIISLNVGLLMSLRGKKSQDEKNIMSQMGQAMRHSWGKEDTQLKELSRRVNRLNADLSGGKKEKNEDSPSAKKYG